MFETLIGFIAVFSLLAVASRNPATTIDLDRDVWFWTHYTAH